MLHKRNRAQDTPRDRSRRRSPLGAREAGKLVHLLRRRHLPARGSGRGARRRRESGEGARESRAGAGEGAGGGYNLVRAEAPIAPAADAGDECDAGAGGELRKGRVDCVGAQGRGEGERGLGVAGARVKELVFRRVGRTLLAQSGVA
jgi:hypothetical protein